MDGGALMTPMLEIPDGPAPYWWESPAIWVVPGQDPLGAPGQPVAGQPAYLWALVRNSGDVDVSGARVDFWWSNPATGVTRTLSTRIGSAFVNLAAGAAGDVLCLVPWTPTIVNDGHECLVAEVVSAADPLPAPPPDVFNPPAYRQIAQRNLTVLQAAAVVLPVQIAAAVRAPDGRRSLTVAVGGELGDAALATLGLRGARPSTTPAVRAGLSERSAYGGDTRPNLTVELRDGVAKAAYLHVEPDKPAKPGEYTVIRIQEKGGAGATYVVWGGPADG